MEDAALARFTGKYAVLASGCWSWLAAKNAYGYGTMSLAGKTEYGHRLSYEHFVGPIDGLELGHLCRNRACVNPAHLERVSHAVNVLRGNGPTAWNKRKTHCVHGHEYTAENTSRHGSGRRCRACKNARSRAAWKSRNS